MKEQTSLNPSDIKNNMMIIKSIQSDVMHFKDDVLKDLKSINSKLQNKFDIIEFEINDKLNSFDSKLAVMDKKITDLSSLITQSNTEKEKIDQLNQFKSKAETSIMSLEVHQKVTTKDLSEAILKYDKLIYDNILYPGMIGANCKFKTFRDFTDYCFTNIGNLLSYKDKQILDLNSYKKKLESLTRQLNIQMGSISQSAIEYTKSSVGNLEEKIRESLSLYDERLQNMRVENGKYSDQLKNQMEKLMDEWEKMLLIKSDIYERLEKEVQVMNNSCNLIMNKFEGYQKEFKLIKSRFTQLSEFIKDVRFSSNLRDNLKRTEILGMSRDINFDKKQVLKNKDETSAHYNNKNIIAESFVKKYIQGELSANEVIHICKNQSILLSNSQDALLNANNKKFTPPIQQNNLNIVNNDINNTRNNKVRYRVTLKSKDDNDNDTDNIEEETDVRIKNLKSNSVKRNENIDREYIFESEEEILTNDNNRLNNNNNQVETIQEEKEKEKEEIPTNQNILPNNTEEEIINKENDNNESDITFEDNKSQYSHIHTMNREIEEEEKKDYKEINNILNESKNMTKENKGELNKISSIKNLKVVNRDALNHSNKSQPNLHDKKTFSNIHNHKQNSRNISMKLEHHQIKGNQSNLISSINDKWLPFNKLILEPIKSSNQSNNQPMQKGTLKKSAQKNNNIINISFQSTNQLEPNIYSGLKGKKNSSLNINSIIYQIKQMPKTKSYKRMSSEDKRKKYSATSIYFKIEPFNEKVEDCANKSKVNILSASLIDEFEQIQANQNKNKFGLDFIVANGNINNKTFCSANNTNKFIEGLKNASRKRLTASSSQKNLRESRNEHYYDVMANKEKDIKMFPVQKVLTNKPKVNNDSLQNILLNNNFKNYSYDNE